MTTTEPRPSATHPLPAELSRSDLLRMYYLMHLARSTEERLEALFRQGHVHGGVYRSLGQEGGAVGTAFALDARADGTGDLMTYLIRDTGAIFTHGGRPIDYLRHYLARATSLSRGRETGVHFTDFQRGLVGPISHLGTMVEVMAGMTWAIRLKGEGRVGMAYLGDGGSSTGEFHEGLNFAAVQECPMVMVLEANRYAFSTPTRKQTRAARLADKAAGYGIPGERVDGNDVLACYEAARRAVDRARAGEGASLIELDTFRRRGHAQHDAQDYVPREELGHWEARDPITLFHHRLLEHGWAGEDELAELEARSRREADAAAEQALSESLPEGPSALDGICTDLKLERPWTRRSPPDPRGARVGTGAGGRGPGAGGERQAGGPTAHEPAMVRRASVHGHARSVPEHVTGSRRGEPVGFLDALAEGLFEEMERDERVVLLGEDVGVYGGAFKLTRGFQAWFGPDRVFDTPISESGFTGAAAGAAHMGLRPVVEMQFMDFISSAYNVVTNYLATSLWRGSGPMPVVIRGPVGAGARSGAFHAQSVEMAFFHTPGLKIVYPSTPSDAKGLLKAAIRDDNPVIFEEHKLLYRDPKLKEVLPGDLDAIPIGKARIARSGGHLTVVTYGRMVHVCAQAADRLEREDGLDVEIVDLRTLLPLDVDAIVGSVRKTNRLLVVHEDTCTGGIAGEISMRVNERAFEWLDAPIARVAAIDTPIPYASTLEDYFLPQAEDVVTAARWLAAY